MIIEKLTKTLVSRRASRPGLGGDRSRSEIYEVQGVDWACSANPASAASVRTSVVFGQVSGFGLLAEPCQVLGTLQAPPSRPPFGGCVNVEGGDEVDEQVSHGEVSVPGLPTMQQAEVAIAALADLPLACADVTVREAVDSSAGPATRVPGDVLVHLRAARDHLDRYFAESTDLAAAASIAGLSKFHFHRLFSATYGVTPADYLTRRRIERAHDLLKGTDLTVTEVCLAVGYSSLGSFSSRFKELVGDTPSAVQRAHAASGAPRVPSCFVFMRGLARRPPPEAGPSVANSPRRIAQAGRSGVADRSVGSAP